MFKWFGGKQAEAPSSEWKADHGAISLKNEASALKTEIDGIQQQLNTVLASTGRATKDERTAIATSSLQTLTKVHSFLNKVIR